MDLQRQLSDLDDFSVVKQSIDRRSGRVAEPKPCGLLAEVLVELEIAGVQADGDVPARFHRADTRDMVEMSVRVDDDDQAQFLPLNPLQQFWRFVAGIDERRFTADRTGEHVAVLHEGRDSLRRDYRRVDRHAIIVTAQLCWKRTMNRAVFFDAVGTVFTLRSPVGRIYAERARQLGFAPSLPALEDGLTASFRAALKRRGPLAFPRAGARLREAERAWWRQVVSGTFAPFGGVERMEELFEDLYTLFQSAAPWRLEEGAAPTLQRLRAGGLRVGMITNYDSRIHDVLEELGVASLFDVVVVSSAAGVAKPDRRIFVQACSLLKTAPEWATHVGDDYEEDFLGARAAGLSAVLFDPYERRQDLKTMRVSRLAELPDILL
jgi:putative hydrolase of the HAD superfamily